MNAKTIRRSRPSGRPLPRPLINYTQAYMDRLINTLEIIERERLSYDSSLIFSEEKAEAYTWFMT